MPESQYSTTPPPATSTQSIMLMEKVTDICKNMDKLFLKFEPVPLQLDRMSNLIEGLGKEIEKTRSELERKTTHLEQDIDKLSKIVDENEKQWAETLKPLIDSKTTIDTVTGWLKVGGVALAVAIYTGWTTMSTRMEALTLQQQSTGQKVATLDEVVREGKAARLAATARIELLEKQNAQTRVIK